MIDSPPCCWKCRGIAPYHFCRDPQKGVIQQGCTCHQKQDAIARRKKAALYADKTADQAIGRVMRGQKK